MTYHSCREKTSAITPNATKNASPISTKTTPGAFSDSAAQAAAQTTIAAAMYAISAIRPTVCPFSLAVN